MRRKSGVTSSNLVQLVYFFALALAFAFGFTSFMGAPQHIRSQATQLQFLSTVTTTPHFSHSYFSPFRAIFSLPQNSGLNKKTLFEDKRLCDFEV
jgi:hypothetical protein